MSLGAQVRRHLGSFELDVDLATSSAETVAILGPNGSGKSTLLRCLAGLLPVDDGRIVLDGHVLDDARTDTFVRPEQRPVAVVFQDYLLFAHLSALENVAFGLRARGMPKSEARAGAREWLGRVGLADQAGLHPRQLSGGQAQRVALARALATEPRMLLLDEPLAALDVATRGAVRRDLRRHLQTFPGVRLIVTHDPVDAYALTDRVVILEGGRIAQSGTLSEVTARPRSRYIADLVGVNLLAGEGRGGVITTSSGTVVVPADPVDGDAFAVIQPHSVALFRSAPEGSPRNSWPSTVVDVDRLADRVRVRLAGPLPLVAEITPAALDALGLRPGDRIVATVKATDVTTYAA